jgi:anti-sigma factor RsiW
MSHGEQMKCRDMVEHLSEYLDDELNAGLRRLIETHGGDCPPCRAFIATLAKTVEAVRSLPREPLPPAAKKELIDALRGARDTENR